LSHQPNIVSSELGSKGSPALGRGPLRAWETEVAARDRLICWAANDCCLTILTWTRPDWQLTPRAVHTLSTPDCITGNRRYTGSLPTQQSALLLCSRVTGSYWYLLTSQDHAVVHVLDVHLLMAECLWVYPKHAAAQPDSSQIC